MEKENQVVELKLGDIIQDENQPRKLFEPTKLKSLQDSIKRYGVMNPIRVEKIGDKYLIEDGERRYRAAKEIGEKTIRAIILPPLSATERLIRQFHVQDQHEEWTATEKATVVWQLSKELGITLLQICELLSLSPSAAKMYIAFSEILDKKNYQKNEVGIAWAEYINRTKAMAKQLSVDVLEEEFTKTDEKKLEGAIIERIKEGQIPKPYSLTRVKDSFIKNPKMIREFMDSNITVDGLFIKSKAKGSYALRNMLNNAMYATTHAQNFMKIKDVKPTKEQLGKIKYAVEKLKEVVDYFAE